MFATSDLHASAADGRRLLQEIRPVTDDDWLLLAGDVGDTSADIEWALRVLRDRFATVVWVPGNHDLWTLPDDPVRLRGASRYRHLVGLCSRLGVLTPEDPYPVWDGDRGPVQVAPLFLLYDYSFRPAGARSKGEALALAEEAGIVCTDEFLLHPDPYPTRDAWCQARVRETERRLADRDPRLPAVLVNHFPLVREPTEVLRHPEFALWCGSERTRDWHRRFGATAVVYGHLHIPRTTWHDGVRFEEVSVGHPREWARRGGRPGLLRQILPEPAAP